MPAAVRHARNVFAHRFPAAVELPRCFGKGRRPVKDQPIRVLVVEDDEEAFVFTRTLFGDVADTVYALDRASTFDEAVKLLEARRHDVYFIDHSFASHKGLELLHKAEEVRLQAPVIMLTGQGETDVDMAAIRAGAADFLIKGEVTTRSLERAVRYAIERNRAELEIEKLAAFPRRNPNPVVQLTENGTLTYSNSAAEALALSIGESSLRNLLPPDIAQVVSESLRTGSTRHFQTVRGTRTFSWTFVPVPENQAVHGYASE